MKIDGWGIAGGLVAIGTAVFGLAKGIHDRKVSDAKQSQAIEDAVNKYMVNKSTTEKTNE